MLAGLADAEREVGIGTVADRAGGVLKASAKMGGDMLASKLGGGFVGKFAGRHGRGHPQLSQPRRSRGSRCSRGGLPTGPDPTVEPEARSQGIERAGGRKPAADQAGKAYGLIWKVGAPPLDACPAIPDGRPAMVKKGSLDMGSDPGGATIATLKKGARVVVLATDGKSLKVQILDGTEGYLEANAMK